MNFQNVAIKCETWQQMQELARIAEGMGLTWVDCPWHTFEAGYVYVMLCSMYLGRDLISNYQMSDIESETITTFTQFINQSDTPSVYGC